VLLAVTQGSRTLGNGKEQRGMWPKDDSQWTKLSRRALWLVLGLLNVGCDPDECETSTMRCNGNVVQFCEPSPCAEFGGGCHAYWDTRADCEDSGQVCAEGSPSEALCALSLVPDPKCRDVGAYCEGSTSVACEWGLAVSSEDCATAPQGVVGDPGAADLPAPTCAISSSHFAPSWREGSHEKPAGCVQDIESCDPGY
jgi:hypothetical protein